MTSGPVLIREMSDAIASRDVRTFSALLHEHVRWEHNLGGGSPEEGVYEGREAVTRLFERLLEPWEYIHPRPDRIEDEGNGTYVVSGELRSKHSTTASEIVTRYHQRLEVGDGQLRSGSMTFGALGPGEPVDAGQNSAGDPEGGR